MDHPVVKKAFLNVLCVEDTDWDSENEVLAIQTMKSRTTAAELFKFSWCFDINLVFFSRQWKTLLCIYGRENVSRCLYSSRHGKDRFDLFVLLLLMQLCTSCALPSWWLNSYYIPPPPSPIILFPPGQANYIGIGKSKRVLGHSTLAKYRVSCSNLHDPIAVEPAPEKDD